MPGLTGFWAYPCPLTSRLEARVIRSAFLIDADGTVGAAFYKISPKDTPIKLLAALEAQ